MGAWNDKKIEGGLEFGFDVKGWPHPLYFGPFYIEGIDKGAQYWSVMWSHRLGNGLVLDVLFSPNWSFFWKDDFDGLIKLGIKWDAYDDSNPGSAKNKTEMT